MPADPLAERPAQPVSVVFSLGANVGAVVESLRTAVHGLKNTEGIEVTQVAPLARTVAVVAEGAEPQPDYLNTVVMAMTTLSPRELLEVCHSLEAAAGRVRTEPWGVRTLDVDLIEVEGVTSADPALSLPHPHAVERAFVLVPWSQADPFAELAGHSVSELAENAPDRGGLRWLAFDWLDSDSLPDKPTGPYVEPPVEQEAADAEPQRVYDATRDESSVANAANASLAADYANSVSGSSPASSAQPLGSQAPVEPAPFDQAPFESSYDAGAWSGQAPQIDSPYQAASAPEASGSAGAAGPQDAYAPGQVDGAGGFPATSRTSAATRTMPASRGRVPRPLSRRMTPLGTPGSPPSSGTTSSVVAPRGQGPARTSDAAHPLDQRRRLVHRRGGRLLGGRRPPSAPPRLDPGPHPLGGGDRAGHLRHRPRMRPGGAAVAGPRAHLDHPHRCRHHCGCRPGLGHRGRGPGRRLRRRAHPGPGDASLAGHDPPGVDLDRLHGGMPGVVRRRLRRRAVVFHLR
ncbi:2-amino-4-hydroxy-6-hydroxymethyldihydropteridine diphosphokinase [Actinomyces naeslundii str. Howell 279]|uniref:2-amino-4-hydroxy-6-hydroxymethyldihydropteridine diphosphokinase n=1 Tax=Actinomyces naeslundii (strain ATCC 12104 / DSM 43013 / CCUG 2238 / JCM 8349 / NCTC 10301 / Howell 279) TaxID=1115803 RepID=J2ZT17_ACTNH|nr:2-amino-4-hydroxy-6-hydroxymethyldihydropteridine diphosphokinase [Actinomyces naeslundii str. Howell 279]